jgi:polyferredoxin
MIERLFLTRMSEGSFTRNIYMKSHQNSGSALKLLRNCLLAGISIFVVVIVLYEAWNNLSPGTKGLILKFAAYIVLLVLVGLFFYFAGGGPVSTKDD